MQLSLYKACVFHLGTGLSNLREIGKVNIASESTINGVSALFGRKKESLKLKLWITIRGRI